MINSERKEVAGMRLGKKKTGLKTVVVSRWCICNAKCHCRNTPAGYSSNFNTAALLSMYSGIFRYTLIVG